MARFGTRSMRRWVHHMSVLKMCGFGCGDDDHRTGKVRSETELDRDLVPPIRDKAVSTEEGAHLARVWMPLVGFGQNLCTELVDDIIPALIRFLENRWPKACNAGQAWSASITLKKIVNTALELGGQVDIQLAVRLGSIYKPQPCAL